jgi:hypothetical protein
MDSENVNISSKDFWFKIVEFLQQNWALIEEDTESEACIIYFISDGSGVFDQIQRHSAETVLSNMIKIPKPRASSSHQDRHILGINTQMEIFIHRADFGGCKLTKSVN